MRLTTLADLFRRVLAAGSAALVLALALLAASPELHERLHAAGGLVGDDHCAVVLFASGVSLATSAVTVLPPVSEWQAQPAVVAVEIFLSAPRYLHQPERGPPSNLNV